MNNSTQSVSLLAGLPEIQLETETGIREPEGLDEDRDASGLDHYPIDSVLVRNDTRTVFETVRRINAGRYIMDPDFQRDFVWDIAKQSRLIQSAIMRIPLPVFYLAEQEDGRTVVVDGLQRLTTFKRYLGDEFALSLVEPAHQKQMTRTTAELHGKTFSQLDAKLKNRIEDTNLVLYLIDAKVPEAVKLDIFDRVNSGVPLTKQQMRNCLYAGNATRWLKEQAQSEEFLQATGGSLNSKAMRDREVINRFCGFSLLGLDRYRGDMDEFLTLALKHMNGMPASELEDLQQRFRLSMTNNTLVFGRFAFRRHTEETERRSVLNVALFDVLSTVMTKYPQIEVEAVAGNLRSAFYELMVDPSFLSAITLGTNQVDRVRNRFAVLGGRFEEVMQNVERA